MKITWKLYPGSSTLILSAMLMAGAAKAHADSDTDDAANYGVRGTGLHPSASSRAGSSSYLRFLPRRRFQALTPVKAKLSPSTRAPIADGVSISAGSIQKLKNCIWPTATTMASTFSIL